MDFGLSIAYSTILIPALTGLNSDHNPDESISITPDQATWLGKCAFCIYTWTKLIFFVFFSIAASLTVICQPIGSIASGFLTGIVQ